LATPAFAAIDLLNDVRPWVTMITRLRLDAALHKPAPERYLARQGAQRSSANVSPH
jgi:hypothetical protein